MCSDPAHIRLGHAVLAWAVVVIAQSFVWPGLLAAKANEAQASAVCVEHLGASDKPVLPLIITSSKPSADILSTLLSTNSDPDFVQLIILPEPEVRRLAVALRGPLKRSPATDASHALSFARITVVIGSSKTASGAQVGVEKTIRTLQRNDALKIFEILERFETADAAAGKELKEALADFRKRTQPK